MGGPAGLSATGGTYYTNEGEISAIKEGSNPAEIIWRENLSKEVNSDESNNYPPSLNGKGRINPTQNLVDAFPAANGYPISDARSEYDAANPYANRDPRLAQYIIYNGATEGPSSKTIYTGSQEGTDDMPAHAKSSIFGVSLTIPITDGRLNLGTWQGIYLCEFRNYGGARKLVATIYE